MNCVYYNTSRNKMQYIYRYYVNIMKNNTVKKLCYRKLASQKCADMKKACCKSHSHNVKTARCTC